MRVLLEIRKPIISLLSDTISNHNQDLISLSTDLVLLYDRKKIQSVKNELKSNYEKFKKNLLEKEKNLTSKQKIKIENDNYDDTIKTVNINLWLYDICPFICKLEEFYQKNLSIPKRKIMNLFDFNYESQTKMQYSDPNNFVITYFTSIVLPNMVLKISYMDIVLLLKIKECNTEMLNKEYEDKVQSFTNKNRNANLINNDKDIYNDDNEINNYINETNINKYLRRESKFIGQNPQNINRYSTTNNINFINNINNNNNLIDINAGIFNNNNIIINKRESSYLANLSKINTILTEDKIIDKGMSIFKIRIEQIQIVK
jgi:hypothetical protein